jgi:hypothetical protein
MANFKYLVRFEDQEGHVQYGEASAEASRADLTGLTVNIYEGSAPWNDDFRTSEKKATISRVLDARIYEDKRSELTFP